MNKFKILLATLVVFGFAFAQYNTPTGVTTAVNSIVYMLCTILPIIIMIAIVASAILFAMGQLGGAESRAKFHGWATNIAIGAITAVLVWVIAPWLLGILMSDPYLFSCTNQAY